MSVEENKELVQRFLSQVMNEHDTAAIPQFMVAGSMFAGAFEGFVNNYIKAAFPDYHSTTEVIFGEGEQVGALTTIRATETGSFMGRQPSGKTYTTTCIYVFKIASGKIMSGQWVFDRMDIAQQLGAMPKPNQA